MILISFLSKNIGVVTSVTSCSVLINNPAEFIFQCHFCYTSHLLFSFLVVRDVFEKNAKAVMSTGQGCVC